MCFGPGPGCTSTHPDKKAIRGDENNVQAISYEVVRSYPHDKGSYTEGLVFHNNQLFESTGAPDDYPGTRSVIGPVDLKTGRIDVRIELDRNRYFGEGIVFFKDSLFQLTYKSQTGFIYNSNTFIRIGFFTYSNKEGWGLTTDGKSIIMSDGTNIITYLDPDSLKVIKTLNITFNGSSALYMNELEYINGYLYANIWTTPNIAKIDPQNGKIVGIIDLSSLVNKVRKEYPMSEVANGIAYDSPRDRIFVTGKFWPAIFQIKFPH